MKSKTKRKVRKRQSLARNAQGKDRKLKPAPVVENVKKSFRLAGKVAIITGADSGIGKAVALMYAKEGADLVLTYYRDRKDARETSQRVKELGARHILLQGDVSDEDHCKRIVRAAINTYKKLDIVINNAAVQYPQDKLAKITKRQIQRTFEVNVFSHLYLVKAAEKYLKKGSSIIHTTSVTAYRGSSHLIDYAATKGAIHAFTKSLAQNLVDQGIRVNCVAPGPVWTPLNPSDKPAEDVAKFGADTPMKRPAQPEEIAPAFVYFASELDSSYVTGEVLTLLGGETTAG